MALGAILPGLLTGGASLISGLFNKKKNNKGMMSSISKSNQERIAKANAQEVAWIERVQASMKRASKAPVIDVEKFHKDAERLGFNPVTYLQSGALGMYNQRADAMATAQILASKTPYHYYERDTGQLQESGMSTGEAFGNALTSGVSAYLSAQQQIDQNDFAKQMQGMSIAAQNQRYGGRSTSTQFAAAAAPAVTSTGSSRVSGVPNSVTGADGIPTPYGTLLQTVLSPKAMEKITEQFGSTVGDVLVPVVYGPDTLNRPDTMKFLEETAKAWKGTVDRYVEKYVTPRVMGDDRSPWPEVTLSPTWHENANRAAKAWRSFERTWDAVTSRRPITPEESRIEYRQRNPNWVPQ